MYTGGQGGPAKGDAHHCKTLKVKKEREIKDVTTVIYINKSIQ